MRSSWGAGGVPLRRGRRELLGTVVVLALLGGVSLFALAGARRTQSAYPRFLRSAHASTMAVDYGAYDPEVDAAIASRPEVAESTTYVAFPTGVLKDGQPDFEQDFETLGTPNGRFFTMDRFTPTSGRLPDPDRVDEIAVNETSAESYGYHVGQVLDLGTYSEEQTEDPSFGEGDAPPPKLRTKATIVGVGLFIDEVVQDDTNRLPLVLVTPAFSKEAAPYATYAWQGLTLRHGDADVASLKAWYVDQIGPGSPQFFRVTSVDSFHAEQAVRPLSLALATFGVIAGLAALVLVSQSLRRWVRQSRTDQDVLRSFGASPRALVLAYLPGPVIAVALGSLAAALFAYLASPLMPVGVVRPVEAARGFDIDWTTLGMGVGALFVVLVLITLATLMRDLPHRRAARRKVRRPSRVVGVATNVGMSPSGVTGMRLAFAPGDDASGGSVRSVMVAGAIAMVALVAALTFGASLRTLLDSPGLYGWNWDSAIFDQSGYGNLDPAAVGASLDDDPSIAGWSGAYFGADSVDGRNIPLLGMELDSDVAPPLLSGRMIEADDEIVLGSATAEELGKGVGDDVRLGVGAEPATVRVVGIATFPTIGIVHGAHTSLGVGALVVPDRVPGFDRQTRDQQPDSSAAGQGGPPAIFVRYADGADPSAARGAVNDAARASEPYPGSGYIIGPQRPAEIVNSNDLGSTPGLMALALAAAAAVSLAIALSSSVRRQRRELALLRSLGFTSRQLAASVAWQATATAGVGVVVGVPLGVALGRQLWTLFADQLDVVPEPSVPVPLVLAVAIGALVVANLAAAAPAHIARRVRPAAVLRAE